MYLTCNRVEKDFCQCLSILKGTCFVDRYIVAIPTHVIVRSQT